MPRAVDPSLFGQQLPITHSPLSRIDYRFRKPDGFSAEDLLAGARTFVTDYLFPTIEELTGIDLSVFLPLLDLLDLDFSSPAAFLMSLVQAILALPAVVAQLLVGLVNELENLPETLTQLLAALLEVLISLPAMLQQLMTGLVPWFDIEGIDFLNGALDGINLEPGGVLRMIRGLIGDGLEDVPLLGEIIQPLTGLMGSVSDLERRFQNLFDTFSLDGGELDLPLDDFNPLTVIDRLIDDRINPLEKLAQLVGGVLPDNQKPNWLQEVNDNIHNAYANLGDPLDLNTNPAAVLDAILGVFGTGRSASSKISGIEARVLALEGGTGPSIILDFNGAATSLSSMSDWNIIGSGGGTGSMRTNGSGSLVWNRSGSSSRTEKGRYTAAALTTDNGIIETVLSTTPQSPSSGAVTPYTYINFRMDNTSTSYTRLLIAPNELRLQYVNGTVTNITSDFGVDQHPKSGDSLRVKFGDAAGANPLHFTVWVNDSEVFDGVASAGPAYGSSNRYIGAGMTTGTNGALFFPTQMSPAGLSVITVAEVL